MDPDGKHEVRFAEPDSTRSEALGPEDAIRIAEATVQTFGLAAGVGLVTDAVRHGYTAAGTSDELIACRRDHEPRGHSPNKVREDLDVLPTAKAGGFQPALTPVEVPASRTA
ncbi:hypothetical protein [Saccharopolyspora hattusasensis]|uniref:hypothetical protein n=1 Tax=Saccharopolyspora hattusasensis TaxID=1128679 RepID=UPI003D95E439